MSRATRTIYLASALTVYALLAACRDRSVTTVEESARRTRPGVQTVTQTVLAPAPKGLTREAAANLIASSPIFAYRTEYELTRQVIAATGIARPSVSTADVEFTWRRMPAAQDIPSTRADERLTAAIGTSIAHLRLFDDAWRVTGIDEWTVPGGMPREVVIAQLDREIAILNERLTEANRTRTESNRAVWFPGRPRNPQQ